MKKKITVKQALKQVNAIFVRKNKHEVWRLPNNQKLTLSVNNRNKHWEESNIKLIEKLMGIKF